MFMKLPGINVPVSPIPVELVTPVLISPTAIICAGVGAVEAIKGSTFIDELIFTTTWSDAGIDVTNPVT